MMFSAFNIRKNQYFPVREYQMKGHFEGPSVSLLYTFCKVWIIFAVLL